MWYYGTGVIYKYIKYNDYNKVYFYFISNQ